MRHSTKGTTRLYGTTIAVSTTLRTIVNTVPAESYESKRDLVGSFMCYVIVALGLPPPSSCHVHTMSGRATRDSESRRDMIRRGMNIGMVPVSLGLGHAHPVIPCPCHTGMA